MTNGEKLREWRRVTGLSQEDAARKLGTSQKTWAAWESGGTPEIDYAEALERLTKGEVTMRDWVRARRRKRKADHAKVAESSTHLVDDSALHAAHEEPA